MWEYEIVKDFYELEKLDFGSVGAKNIHEN